jgi:hypothetical protein
MRRLISVSLAAAVLLAAVPVALGLLQRLPDGHGAAASSTLTCSVKASCGEGEVAVFRMSGQANAHAQTAAGTTYANVVCCSGPAGLSTSCSGSYATVLRLWAADNAHVASNDLSYGTQVCLSATDTAMNCQYGSTCGSGYACLATISGTTNAHVADCDGSGDYATKVCCRAQPDMNSDSGPPPPSGYVGAIGNGRGIVGDDATVANGDALYDACDDDFDNDGYPDDLELLLPDPSCPAKTALTSPGGDITYDDDNDGNPAARSLGGTDPTDDPASWDSDGDGRLDGAECKLGTDPANPASRPTTAQCGGLGDDDGDGLKNTWEVCKWGTDPTVLDSDGDTLGDCKEAADVDGNRNLDFTGDVMAYAQAIFLAPAAFGQDGDFDIDGNNNLDFTGDVMQEAQFALIDGLCK